MTAGAAPQIFNLSRGSRPKGRPSRPEGSARLLAVSPEDDEGSALGVTVSELQTGVTITGEKISGTLHQKDNFEAFSKTDNSGNFLVLKVEYPEDAQVKLTVVGGTTKDKKMDDHQLVVKVKDAATQKIKLDITRNGETGSITYDLSGLTLEGAD